ncbi:hypothetical protein [Thalassobacillus sp. CUG 92003]|uniref:hypothetical protein n=1 Tax=Thalassobacillus sp. CUG 92003 TaxID=2736641 RepID=UPI00351A7FF7
MSKNQYTLGRYEGEYAILMEYGHEDNELSILKERVIAFANLGDRLSIQFDNIGNLKQVQVIKAKEDGKDTMVIEKEKV